MKNPLFGKFAALALTFALAFGAAPAAPAEARDTAVPGRAAHAIRPDRAEAGPLARAAGILQLTAAAAQAHDADLAADLATETDALAALLAADPAARESFRTFRLRVPEAFRPALDPAIDRMVEALAGKTDPMEARRTAGEAFPDRGDAAFDPADAEALRKWLVEMNFLPAADGRDFNGFKAGIMKKGKFRFDDEACYGAGHEHHCCMCRYEQKSAWSEQMNEGGNFYLASRSAELYGVYYASFESTGLDFMYTLAPKPGAVYADPAKKITRCWTLFHETNGKFTGGHLEILHADGDEEGESFDPTPATRDMAKREMSYWSVYYKN